MMSPKFLSTHSLRFWKQSLQTEFAGGDRTGLGWGLNPVTVVLTGGRDRHTGRTLCDGRGWERGWMESPSAPPAVALTVDVRPPDGEGKFFVISHTVDGDLLRQP